MRERSGGNEHYSERGGGSGVSGTEDGSSSGGGASLFDRQFVADVSALEEALRSKVVLLFAGAGRQGGGEGGASGAGAGGGGGSGGAVTTSWEMQAGESQEAYVQRLRSAVRKQQ